MMVSGISRVLDPAMNLKGMAEEDTWGEDPVHPMPTVYSKIAEAVVKISATMEA
jgi:hypothetical protein